MSVLGYGSRESMDVTPAEHRVEILDPLMFNDLANEYPSIMMKTRCP